jgi:demethylmenaquinone methyltransferase/2-methoxy-6-polyprenyl-1,4-benzoquinol methylase
MESMDKKQFVLEIFGKISSRYDLTNALLSGFLDGVWRMKTVRALGVSGRALILDVCAGTLPLSFELLRDPSKICVGLDMSLEMLRVGRSKLPPGTAGRLVGLVCGDAERLPFRDGRFDGAMVAFGVRNMTDMGLGLAELFRVLKPGGRLAVLEFSRPSVPVLGSLYRAYLHHVLPRLAGVITGHRAAYEYLARSIHAFSDQAALTAMHEQAGFARVRSIPLTLGVVSITHSTKPS